MVIDIRDSLADAKRRKADRRERHRDFDYLKWLHYFPCLVCPRNIIEAHHQPRKSQEGWHDRKTIPLCAKHHRGKNSVHMLGVEGFEAKWNVKIESVIEKLNKMYDEEME